MANGNEYDFFQIPHTGVDDTTLGNAVQTRSADMKISDFNAMYVGLRRGDDYTRTDYGFADKEKLSNWASIVPEWQEAERDQNPYLEGSTVKRVRDDQFIRLGMAKDSGAFFSVPRADHSDTKQAEADVEIYMPLEGWRSFGGKYDFSIPYQGSKLRGNLL